MEWLQVGDAWHIVETLNELCVTKVVGEGRKDVLSLHVWVDALDSVAHQVLLAAEGIDVGAHWTDGEVV